MNAIEIRGLDKSFGSLQVLDRVDLEVPAGAVFALLGPNGAGKTTLINIATTLLRPDRGEVRVAGHDVVTDPAAVRRLISVTGQQAAVDEVLTVTENLILMGRLRGLAHGAARRRAQELNERLGLTESADSAGADAVRRHPAPARPRSVSRLPVAGDLPGRADHRARHPQPADIVGDHRRTRPCPGVTIFLTTQYLEEADRLASRVAVLNAGSVVAVGDPRALKARIGQEVLEIRDGDDTLLAELPVDGTLASFRQPLAALERSMDPAASVSLAQAHPRRRFPDRDRRRCAVTTLMDPADRRRRRRSSCPGGRRA